MSGDAMLTYMIASQVLREREIGGGERVAEWLGDRGREGTEDGYLLID